MIRRATDEDTAAVRRMWEECFPDGGPAFAQWYFTRIYRSRWTIGLFEGGELLANLQMVPYTLMLRGREVAAEALTGVATGATHRNRGLAKALMSESAVDMAARGIGFNFLYPFDHTFYRRQGWETCSTALEYALPAENLPDFLPHGWEAVRTCEPDIDALSHIYTRFMAGRNCFVARSAASFARRVGETCSTGGFAVVVCNDGMPRGYALCEEMEGEVAVGELAYDDLGAVEALLAALAPLKKPVVWTAPEDDRLHLLPGRWKDHVKLQPHVMFRVMDVPLAFTQAAPATDGAVAIEVTGDSLRTENNGHYLVTSSMGQARAERTETEPQISMGVGTLARVLTGFMTAGEAAALGLVHGDAEALALLDEMYPRQRNFLFELY